MLALAALAAVLAIGVQLRLEDPMSTTALPAEDPYNHMALVREHVRDGNVQPLYEEGGLYPPGMHAFLAASWAYTGADLLDVMRLGPVLFGALGLVGVALLLWRSDGPTAAVVGALAMALAPEIVFRTTMMAPTAVDVGLMPFFFYAMLRLMRGHLGWIGVAAPMTLYFVFAHPWALSIIAGAGGVFLLLTFLMPWPQARGSPMAARGVVAAVTILGVGWAMSLGGCFGWCGRGFQDIAKGGAYVNQAAPLIAGLALLPVAIYLFAPRALTWIGRSGRAHFRPSIRRVLGSIGLGAFLVLVLVPAIEAGFPEFVNLPRMFGWPMIVLASMAFVALPFVPSRAGLVGAAIVIVTLPFVVHNPLDSPFWPHRTALYLGIGIVLLAGVAAGAGARGLALVASRSPKAAPSAFGPRSHTAARPMLAVLVVLLVASTAVGTVYAATPETYPGGWYRLYSPCEMEGMEAFAANVTNQPDAIVVTGDWQAKLVLAAMTTDASRVWFKGDFYTDQQERDNVTNWLMGENRPLYVVVDKYLRQEAPEAETDFLSQDPWQEVGHWCDESKRGHPTTFVYEARGDSA